MSIRLLQTLGADGAREQFHHTGGVHVHLFDIGTAAAIRRQPPRDA